MQQKPIQPAVNGMDFLTLQTMLLLSACKHVKQEFSEMVKH